ncbi:MAG TPA: glutathione transferase GstA [Paucimonas sp.]|nr:glutathione transferase GstA [Paucimonas sp.]
MKLYFTPGACSLSPHIVLREGGFRFDIERVDLKTKKTATGADYLAVNPKGYVPALELDGGGILTEGPAIVQYLADQVPDKKLAPPAGTMERYRLMEWLNFISAELHKAYSPFFRPDTPEAAKEAARQTLTRRIGYLSQHLEKSACLMGEDFTVADAYLFTILSWHPIANIDLAAWPAVRAYVDRIGARPAVREALDAEEKTKSR